MSLLAVVGAAGGLGACGTDGATIGNSDDASAESSAPGDDSGPATDAAADAELITDGGANIDPDAGLDDGGLDGGACNTLANEATPVTSTCISVLPALGGGALVSGKYFLTGVAALGGPAFCKNQFIPTGFKETLDLAVAGGAGTLTTVTEIGGPPLRHRDSTLTPGAGNTSPATGTAVCPVGNTGPVRYASAVVGGKQVLLLHLAYGAGTAIYRFEKQ